MAVTFSAVRPTLSAPRRLVLFGVAVALGAIAGSAWSVEASAWAYNGLIRLFADPALQIASLGMGVGVAFLLGLVHIFAI
jgi:hypothetical protein